MGAGLGGGSSNAAAVLMALPALAGKPIPFPDLVRLAESLGSDVPFFLHGGTALGLGRGTEVYPLPDLPRMIGLVVATGIHVSTQALMGTKPACVDFTRRVSYSERVSDDRLEFGWFGLDQLPLQNDFEEAVFGIHQGTVRRRPANCENWEPSQRS